MEHKEFKALKPSALAGIRLVPQDVFLLLLSTQVEVTARVEIDGTEIPIKIEVDTLSWKGD